MSGIHKFITLNDGHKVPSLAFGTGTALYGKDAESAVVQAIEAGFIHLDAAEVYANEESVGAAIRASGVPREKLFITTKLARDDARGGLEDSLRKLGLDYVDLYLIHSPLSHKDIQKTWADIEALQAEGKAKSIGVSNFRVSDLETLLKTAKVVPAINQLEFHPLVAAATVPLLAFHKKHNVHIASYGPLTPIVRRSSIKGDGIQKLDAVLDKAVEKRPEGTTKGQILLAWALQKTGGEVVTTSSKPDRLKEVLAVLDLSPALSDEEISAIEAAGKEAGHHRVFMKHLDETN